MPIDPSTPRAREIARKREVVVALLRDDPFRSDAALARECGFSDMFVRGVRQSLPADADGVILPGRGQPLPRTPVEVQALKSRDVDDLVAHEARLLDAIDALRAENAALRRELAGAPA